MKINNREVENEEIDNVDMNDYPKFCDASFSFALFTDTGEELNDDELDLLTDIYPDVLNELANEYYI